MRVAARAVRTSASTAWSRNREQSTFFGFYKAPGQCPVVCVTPRRRWPTGPQIAVNDHQHRAWTRADSLLSNRPSPSKAGRRGSFSLGAVVHPIGLLAEAECCHPYPICAGTSWPAQALALRSAAIPIFLRTGQSETRRLSRSRHAGTTRPPTDVPSERVSSF